MEKINSLYFHYRFIKDSQMITFNVKLDPQSLDYILQIPRDNPQWTRLDYMVCDNCPLHNTDAVYCPVAVNLVDVVEAFKDTLSYDVVDVLVEIRERTYARQQIPIQQALSSLLGIIMVTSGCGSLDKLRPMVRFHLPFASIEETVFRVASTYLLAQYFRVRKGLQPDWEMKHLVSIYQNIARININICKRLQQATSKDASLNAVVILDTFAQMMPLTIEETLKDFEHLFTPYIKE